MHGMCENHGSKVLRPSLRADEVGAGIGCHFFLLFSRISDHIARAAVQVQAAAGEDTAGSS